MVDEALKIALASSLQIVAGQISALSDDAEVPTAIIMHLRHALSAHFRVRRLALKLFEKDSVIGVE